MDPNRYHLTSTWQLPAGPERVYRVLQDVAGYPAWWPQIRSVRRIDDRTGELRVRSFLPYELLFTVHEQRQDAGARLLQAELRGDLQGWSRWQVSAAGPGSVVVFEEEVRPGKPLMRRLAPLARPLFLANHAVMMRSGERGLRALLSAPPATSSASGP
ncbi:SRPBCC family protein [Kitasatospora atroaurantiaca]|uniref:Polyketide cyclase/dehydrase/lipid transport protein n=1 Tax=Kitasatospora atroaurantiaca TaxID=285545 RepID=A0A561EWT6_9ACTN|nr:SRPBCC family protein [Kitasatospora atroaurantiaca]TWE20076.1 polyketide cyclase/dehydrase/lipid transport protein [Kitasatospora atroaurantiaca]